MHQSNTINNIEYHNKNLMNARDKLIPCYQKAGLILAQVNTTIPSCLLEKRDGTLRMCIDYCSINNNTIINQYPLPRIDDILDCLGGSMVYIKLNSATGYHQLAIKPKHTYRTAF